MLSDSHLNTQNSKSYLMENTRGQVSFSLLLKDHLEDAVVGFSVWLLPTIVPQQYIKTQPTVTETERKSFLLAVKTKVMSSSKLILI